jgi:transposase InsO family protein
MAESTTAAAAAERLRSASPDDIQQALGNLAKLKSDPAQVYVPERTREWLKARYREGELKYGDGFLGLLGREKEKGNRTAKVNSAVIDLTTQVVEELLLVKGATTKAASYGELRLRCIEKALTPPSEKFFRRFVNHINKQRLEEATKGRKAAHQYETWVLRLEYATPRHGQRPFEIGHIDHTELDLQMRDEAYGMRTLKAWLTVLIDAYSRKILAWHLTFDSPSSSSLMCVIRECLRKHGRGCDIYVVDQGSEFNSKYFEALLARLRASKRERPASKPRFGNIIERFFRTATDDFIKQLRGANEILKKPRSVSPSHDPRRSAIWTLRSFMKEWEHWLESFYHERNVSITLRHFTA